MTLHPDDHFREKIKQAGQCLLDGDYKESIKLYMNLLIDNIGLVDSYLFNFTLARRRFFQDKMPGARRSIAFFADQHIALEKLGENLNNLDAVCCVFQDKDKQVDGVISRNFPKEKIIKFVLDKRIDAKRSAIKFVLENPAIEVHFWGAGEVNNVFATYYRLAWWSDVYAHVNDRQEGLDPRSLSAKAASVPLPKDGFPEASLGLSSRMDGVISNAPMLLQLNNGQIPPVGELLDKTSKKLFSILDGWAGFASPIAKGGSSKKLVSVIQAQKTCSPSGEKIESSAPIPVAINATATELKQSLLNQLSDLNRLYPGTPYYGRLRKVVDNCEDIAALSRVEDTLFRVDLVRQGQVPRLSGPLVSVVMPAFNREHLISDAIRSVLAQSYSLFELIVCDDASVDKTVEVIKSFNDKRIHLIRQEKRSGAAAARNRCLAAARGDVIAYLDSDNIWHPRYLELALEQMAAWSGYLAVYAGFFDIQIAKSGVVKLRSARLRPFHLEDQIEKPFIDLNSFVHSRRLYDTFGGFDERLARRQDYDLISRYCWSREPRLAPYVLNIYQRLDNEEQITRTQSKNVEALNIIQAKIDGYYNDGLSVKLPSWLKKVSVLSWDMSRNHFAKAFCVADALSKHLDVELISFRFFEDRIFPPLADVKPGFDTKYFDGGKFPEFFDEFAHGLDAITGDAIYAVKPRLTSFGMGLLANYHTGKPLMVECNDLETVVSSPQVNDAHSSFSLKSVFDDINTAATPYELIWSQVLDPLVNEIPVVFTHNINLNIHYRNRCLYMRNIKDDRIFNPTCYDREDVRKRLGLSPADRVILFGGLVRKHKGIFELINLLDRLGDVRYKLLVVGSRDTPDLKKVSAQHCDRVVILPPQTPEKMAEINMAADLVVLWQDPSIPAGHYQSPYKMSDAFAMGPSIISTPTSDLADFARRQLIWNVAFGDYDGLIALIHKIFANPEERQRRKQRAHAFFTREFSYKSVLPAFALGASGLEPNRVYPVAERFAQFFAEFEARSRRSGR